MTDYATPYCVAPPQLASRTPLSIEYHPFVRAVRHRIKKGKNTIVICQGDPGDGKTTFCRKVGEYFDSDFDHHITIDGHAHFTHLSHGTDELLASVNEGYMRDWCWGLSDEGTEDSGSGDTNTIEVKELGRNLDIGFRKLHISVMALTPFAIRLNPVWHLHARFAFDIEEKYVHACTPCNAQYPANSAYCPRCQGNVHGEYRPIATVYVKRRHKFYQKKPYSWWKYGSEMSFNPFTGRLEQLYLDQAMINVQEVLQHSVARVAEKKARIRAEYGDS